MREAASAFVQILFVGWGWSFVGDVFYPGSTGFVSFIPAIAVTIMGLHSVSLAKPTLAKAGVAVVDDPNRWNLFSAPRIAIYVITMMWVTNISMFWQDGAPPFSVLAFLFIGLAYVNGYALARIPSFTVAYLTDATPDQERKAARGLLGPTVLVASPAIAIVAFLLATTAPSAETYVDAFIQPGTFFAALIPILYFPYFAAVSYNLLHHTAGRPDRTSGHEV